MIRNLMCRARTVWETATMGVFWRTLRDWPNTVVASGHLWPVETSWSAPLPSPRPESWGGRVQFDLSACVRCGHVESPAPWRRYYA